MADANELLQSSSIKHAHHLEGYKRLLAKQAWELLNDSYRDAVSRLALITDYGSAPGRSLRETMSRAQLDQYIRWADATLSQGYTQFELWFISEMQDFSEFEATYQVASIGAAANGRVMPDVTSGDIGDTDEIAEPPSRGVAVAIAAATPTAQDLWVAVSTRPFAGHTMEEHFLRLSAEARDRYERTVRQSWVEGMSLQQTMQALRGTSTTGYKDGVISQSRREQETFVRTGTNHVAATSVMVTQQQNENIIKGWRFLATLDGRTSRICSTLDSEGEIYPIGEGPYPPRHPNCRSVPQTVLKSWRELGFDINEPEAGTRASFAPQGVPGLTGRMSSAQVTEHLRREGYSPEEIRQIKERFSGQVPDKTTYDQFLRNQSVGFQEDNLGKTKARLFREGRLPITKFTNDMGRERTLDELKRLYPIEWQRAGLAE